MTVVIVAFMDSDKKAVAYRKFTDLDNAASFYRRLLELACFASAERKPRIISTRIIL
mgnify:CR=1 FL=1